MPIRNFPLRQWTPDGPPHAILELLVSNPHDPSITPLKTMAIIDTGADASLFPKSIGELLKHNNQHPKVKKEAAFGFTGHSISYIHTFKIEILDPINYRPVLTIPNLEIAVLKEECPIVLGINDFLLQYVLTIDFPKNTFSLRIP